jgi:LacI family transcriptional regulator
MGVTIKDVASRAGVSTATVSYVINNSRFVVETTREKVERAMAELAYSPNTLARSLRVRRSKTIGMVVPQISNPSFTDSIHGVEKVLQANGYNLLISESGEDWSCEIKLIKVFNAMFVDGVIIMASGKQQGQLKEALKGGGYPTVFLDRSLKEIKGDVVTLDNFRSTMEATRLLIERGRTRIALLVGPAQHSTTQDRIKGYRQAHRDCGLDVDSALIRHGDYGLDSGKAMAGELLGGCRPDAFFAASADMTLGAFIEARAMKLNIPKDLSIIGCHDSAWANVTDPPLSMISQPSSELGRLAAELLLKRIAAPGGPCKCICLPTQLTIRGSL